MDSKEYFEWFVVRVRCGEDSLAIVALTDAGIRHFDPEYYRCGTPIVGCSLMSGKVFPGHIFVAVEPSQAMLARLGEIPGIFAVFRDEKGRPMCIRPERIAELETYCRTAFPGDVPSALCELDLLYGGERLRHFLDYCWGPPPEARSQSSRSRISASD